MRKNIKIEDVTNIIKTYSVQTLLGVETNNRSKAGFFFPDIQDHVEMFESEEFPGTKETDVAAFIDPRTASQGVRILCADGSFEFEDEETPMSLDPAQYYDKFRLSIGLLESAREMGSQFPLNINLHQINAVSFTKGCYLGQELTQRTYHTGVVRRVALPFIVDSLPR